METDKWKQAPRCFNTREDYELWLDSRNTETHLQYQHCTDCLPSFKMRMAACGRCEHPETVFSFTPSSFDGEDGVSIEGSWVARPAVEVEEALPYQPPVQIVRFVKQRGRPRKPKPVVKTAQDYWAEQERKMRERMSFGR